MKLCSELWPGDHPRSGSHDGCMFNFDGLPILEVKGIWSSITSTGRTYFTSVTCTHLGVPPSFGITCS